MKVKPIWISDSKGETGIQGIQGIQGETGTSDHLILRSIDDLVPGFIKDKITSDEYLDISDVTEDEIKKLLIALKNPLYYVKGDTIYGGNLVTTLNEFTRTTFFTCYYNATGAPPVQAGNPSWFGIHINSNVGVASGIDMAWAYLTNGIICYERSKVDNVFGGWRLRGSSIKQTAINKTGTDMTKGTAVALYGSSGERIQLHLLESTQTVSEQVIVAVLDENIAKNAEGPVTRSGRLVMDTNSWNEGDILYASTTPGVLSNVAPAKGYSFIPVGIVIKKAGATDGIVFVNPFPVPRISQLPDVSVSSPTDGQVLTYQASTGLWIPGSGEPNAWYLDTIKGDDLNSGLSPYSPKKTGDAIINAIKATTNPSNILYLLNWSANFDAANWTSTSVPNLSIFCEAGYGLGNIYFSNITSGSLFISGGANIQFTSCTLANLCIDSPLGSVALYTAVTLTGRVNCDCKYFQTVSGTLTYNGEYSGDTFFVRAYNFECDVINNGSMEINASFCMLNSYSSNNASLAIVSKYVNLGGALSSIRSTLYIKTDLLQQNSTFLVDSGTSTSISSSTRFSLDIDAGYVNQNYGMDILSTYGVCNVRMKTSILYSYRSPKSIIINALNYDIVCQFDIGSITFATLSPDEDHAMIALYAPTAGKKLALDVRISSMKQDLGILGTYDTNECFIKKYSEVGSILVKLNNTDALNKVEYFDGYGLDGFTGYSSRPRWILSGRNTTLGTAYTDLEKIIFILKRGPEATYTDEYLMRFTTNAANALKQIKLCYDYGVTLTTGKDISDRILKLTAAQCDTLYALGSNLVLVTATKNVTWNHATKTITAGSEYQVLGLNAAKDSYIYCDKTFGVVTALGSIVPTLANSVQLCPEEVQLENSSDYVISASSGTATITGKNTSISLVSLDAKNTEEWFLDTYSGDDSNSGLSTYAPMKTASAIIAKIADLISGGESASKPRRLNILYNSYFNNPSVVIDGITGIPFYDIEAPDGVTVSITNSTWSFGGAKIRGGSYILGGNTINSGMDIEVRSLSITSTENWSSGTFVIDVSDSISINSNWNINNCSCRIKCGNSINAQGLWNLYGGSFFIDIEENLNVDSTKNINTYSGNFYFDLKGTLNLEGAWTFYYCNLFLNSKEIIGNAGTLVGTTGATKTIIKTDYYSLTNYIVASSVSTGSIFRISAKRLNTALTNPIINYGANTGITCDVLIEVDEIGSRAPTVGNTQGNSTCKVWQFKYPDFVEQNTWYLDTVSGNDSNSGLSRGAPKKTGDALVIAAKAVGKVAGKLVIMTANSGVVFTSANWSSTDFPFFDVECESAWTTVEWNSVVFSAVVKIRSGVHTFNTCTGNASQTLLVHQAIVNGGVWSGQTDIDSETSLTANGMTCGGTTTIRTPNLSIPSMLMVYGSTTIQTASIYGEGSIGSYSNMQVWLDIQTTLFSLEGFFQFPSQVDNSSIKITIAKMARTAITKLLYLGANTGITVNYQLVVDSMGSIVPLELGNPVGTVFGKVIELLKYENKVDAEIIRATAAEALKADLVGGKVPTAQLPSYIDDVLDAYVVGSTPFASDWLSLTVGGAALTPESGKIYIVLTAGAYEMLEFRWSGTVYAEISKSLAQEIGYVASGDALGANASISLQAGSSTQWSAHGVLSSSTSKLTPEVGTSLLGCIVSQVVTGGHFIIATYKVESGGAHSLICSTGVLDMPASAGWLNGTVALISSTNKFVPPNELIYFVIMTDINGASVVGSSASGNLDIQPYASAINTNMGVLTEAPATLTFEGETPLRPFVFLRKSVAADSVGMVDDEGYLIVDDADNVVVWSAT